MLSNYDLKEDLKNYENKFRLTYEWTKTRIKNASGPTGWYAEKESIHIHESLVSAKVLLFLNEYLDFVIYYYS